jgi:hypothetical protein
LGRTFAFLKMVSPIWVEVESMSLDFERIVG